MNIDINEKGPAEQDLFRLPFHRDHRPCTDASYGWVELRNPDCNVCHNRVMFPYFLDNREANVFQ